MKTYILIFTAVLLMSCGTSEDRVFETVSANGEIKLSFNLSDEGEPYYMVRKGQDVIIDTSFLGFEFKNAPAFDKNFIAAITKSLMSEIL